jgi:hypothetical protein
LTLAKTRAETEKAENGFSIYNYTTGKMPSINFRRNDDTGNNEAIKILFSGWYPQLVTILNFKTPNGN